MGLVVGGTVTCFITKRAADATLEKTKKNQQELEKENSELKSQIEDAGSNTAAASKKVTADDWATILINESNPLDTAYAPELAEFQDAADKTWSVDARILDYVNKMFADAKEASLNLEVVSAYRSPEDQKNVFNDSMQDRLDSGMGYYDAFVDTKHSVACPGCSEHASGLSLDIISGEYTELDDRQATTAEAQWLAENCQKYGFILRYPPEKADVTGIIYEPWHYRYVGVDVAKDIMSKGITLEEYCEGL